MNSSCPICLDLFDGQDIGATKCGHVFHCKCILKWIDNSKFCPECRATVTRNNVSKLFFNTAHSETLPLYPSIQNDLDTKKAELREKEAELSVSNKKIKELQKHAASTEQLYQSMYQKYLASQSEVETYKLQLKNVEKLEKKIKNLVQENINLESQVNQFNNIQTILQGSQHDAEEILREQTSLLVSDVGAQAARNLANLCSILKRELSKLKEQRVLTVEKQHELAFSMGLKNAKIRSLRCHIVKLEQQLSNAASSPCKVALSCTSSGTPNNLSIKSTPVSTHFASGSKPPATAKNPSQDEASELVAQSNQLMELTPVSTPSTSRRQPLASAANPSKDEKASEITPITINFSERKRPAIKKVVLNNTTEQSMSVIKPVLPFLKPVLNPLKRKPDLDEDSIMRIGYDGLGGHERVIFARSRELATKPYKKNPNVKKVK